MNDEVQALSPPLPAGGFFDPSNNYWQIAGETEVFWAAGNIRVPTTDANYAAWLAKGNQPTPINSEIDLWGVVRTYLADRYPEWLIKGYAAQKRWDTEVGGLDYSPTGGPSSGVVLRIKTDRDSQAAIDASALAAQRYPTWTAQWKTADGTFHTLDANTIIEMSGSVQWHIQRCFETEQNCAGYTMLSQVDAAFVALTTIQYPDPAQPQP
jgi:Domain of unknown function (DUF4376)